MPTSPRDLTDGKCRLLWENLPFCHRTSRADVGIGPYAVGETILSRTTAECFRGPLHTRRCGGTFPQGKAKRIEKKVIIMTKLLIINPGSTSTKVSYFEDEKNVYTESMFHDAPELLKYPTTNDQMPMRMEVLHQFLESHGMTAADIDVFVGRGGCAYSQKAGVMVIDGRLVEDTAKDLGGSDHPAKLGVMLAYELGRKYGKPMYTVNPTNVDELCDYARLTGITGLYRRAQTHVLNQKGIAAIHAKILGKKYEDLNLIVCHVDGGITVTAHRQGKMIDSTEGAGGDGPFTPTRLGSIPVMEVLQYLDQGHSTAEMRAMLSRSGGFVSHFGTSDAAKVHSLVDAGDPKGTTVWNAMVYQLCKSIGGMAAVLEGKVDGILLTGGLMRYDDIRQAVETRCGWIAPISVYPGECEQEAMADAVLEVLRGEKEASRYTGKPVFEGFPWDK